MFERLVIPEVFSYLGQRWLKLSPHQMRRWWIALSHAHHEKAVLLRTAILCQAALPYSRTSLYHLAYANMKPSFLIEALEVLVDEGLLLRREASQIEEHILRQLTAIGQWK